MRMQIDIFIKHIIDLYKNDNSVNYTYFIIYC